MHCCMVAVARVVVDLNTATVAVARVVLCCQLQPLPLPLLVARVVVFATVAVDLHTATVAVAGCWLLVARCWLLVAVLSAATVAVAR
jgi:hypothetical protein